MLHSSVLEAASWRLAAEISRRHPQLVDVRREHPGGGQYDVLALRSPQGLAVMLNRRGTIQIHGRHDGRESTWQPTEWQAYLSADPFPFITKLEEAAGLPSPLRTPSSTSKVLVHRILSSIASLHFLKEPVRIEMGYIDSSGYGAGEADWLREVQSVDPALLAPQEDDPFGEPGYRFWKAEARDLRLVFETGTGTVWGPGGGTDSVMRAYEREGRNMLQLTKSMLELGALSAS